MPPKKGKKKTKAELEAEKLLKEEEDAKIRALEEKKAKEDAEKKRLEDIRIQIQRNSEREIELGRLKTEYLVYKDDLKTGLKQMVAEEIHENAAVEWTKYREPNEEPNADNEREMNTFLTLANETEVQDLSGAFKLLAKVESAAKLVNNNLSECIITGNIDKLSQNRQYLLSFYDLMLSKLDKTTNHMLRFIDNHLNEKQELQFEENCEQIGVGIWAPFAESRPPRRAVIFDKIGIQLDMIKQVLQHEIKFVYRVIRMPIDQFSTAVYDPKCADRFGELISSNKYVIGSIFLIDFLFTPPSPIPLRQRRWVLRECSGFALSLRRALYPTSVPTKCILKVPESVIMSDNVRVAVWKEETSNWGEEGTSLFEYQEAERKAIFYTVELGAFALIRDRNCDFPFKRWYLAPFRDPSSALHEKTARLTVQTQNHEVVIEILSTACRLMRINCSAFDDIIGVEMSSGVLLRTLQRRGLNLMYIAGEVAGVSPKTPSVEKDVLSQIGRCASACEFSSSNWNQQLPETAIGILVKESTVYTGSIESFDFECVLAELDATSESCRLSTLPLPAAAKDAGESQLPENLVKYTTIMGNEYGTKKEFSPIPRPDEVTHITVAAALQNRLTVEAVERINRVNTRFANAVTLLLNQLKLFSLA